MAKRFVRQHLEPVLGAEVIYTEPVRARFWAKVDRSGDCWLWTASQKGQGYGSFGIASGTMRRAHRVAWEMEHGPIPPGGHILHSCGNRLCVRVEHLRVGTHKENMIERSASGTTYRRGPAKLSVDAVSEMRRMRDGGETVASIARHIGISATHAGAVVSGKYWR